MALSKIMTARVVTVHLDDALETIRYLFEETGFHHLIVVDQQRAVGVISDRDLLRALSPFIGTISERASDRALLERKAHQIMSRDMITLKPTDTIVSAVSLFNRHSISCIPIVDENMHLQGILSWRDIMHYVQTLVDKKRQA